MTFDEAVEIVGEAEPSEDEIKNGWTIESLTIYLAERAMANTESVLSPRPVRPRTTNNSLRWIIN